MQIKTSDHQTKRCRPHLDGSDGEGDLPPTIDVRVENTKNVLELLRDDQRLKTQHIQDEGCMNLIISY